MLLSVIIPVYKVEHTLNRCVESVLCQNIEDMEIILVDDGSPDSCPEICDKWAAKSSLVKVIHKPNGGLSDARNAGIDIAIGDYITFIDSDDYLADNTLLPLLHLLKKNPTVDLLEYSIKQEDKERKALLLSDTTYTSTKIYWHETLAWNHSYAWNKIYKRIIFDKERYDKGCHFEDLLLLPRLLKHCSNIMTTSHGTYVYTVNDNGISKQVNKKNILELLKAELMAAWTTHTMPWNKNACNLYYGILCRLYDLLKP